LSGWLVVLRLRIAHLGNFDHYKTTHENADSTVVKSEIAKGFSSIARSLVAISATGSVFAVTTVSEFAAV
jgi:hypothetical protein